MHQRGDDKPVFRRKSIAGYSLLVVPMVSVGLAQGMLGRVDIASSHDQSEVTEVKVDLK